MPLRLSAKVTKWINWLLLISWMGVIFYFSNQSDPRMPGTDIYLVRKAGHVGEFLVLFVLWIRALRQTASWHTRHIIRLAWLLTIAYAISDEYHQTFIAKRSSEIMDVVIDALAPSGVWLCYEKFATPATQA